MRSSSRSPRTSDIRRRAPRLLAIAVALGAAIGSTPSIAGAGAPGRHDRVYMTRDEALADVFPQAARIERVRLRFSPEERKRIERRCRRRIVEKSVDVYRAFDRGGALAGYAVITDEIGKYQPITFIVAVSPAVKVSKVAILVYREPVGAEIRRQRFLSQFRGKSTRSALRINRDVIHISGATLSSRAIARGVRKVVHVIDECVTGPHHRRALAWREHRRAAKRSPAPGKEVGARVDPVPRPPAPPPPVSPTPVHRARYLMGTVLEVVAFGEERVAEPAVGAALDEVARIEALLSTYRPESEVSTVNRLAALRPVQVSRETIECVGAALDLARATGGAFDPTLARDGHAAVKIDRQARTIRFLRPGLHLDLGGIGKGFALDRAAAVLEERGITAALLNFGGQILALDPPPGETAWCVPVRDPRDPRAAIGFYEAVRGSISTSATYERGDHIIDPRTGTPAAAALSTTVCAPSATLADGLSTAIDVLGAGAAAELASRFPETGAVVVPPAGPLVEHRAAGAPRFVATATVAARTEGMEGSRGRKR